MSVEQLKIGDRVQVLNGAQIPTDGVVIEGSTAVDESSINGESIPKEKNSGDPVFGSTMNGSGTIVVEVTKDSSETVLQNRTAREPITRKSIGNCKQN